MTLGSRVKPLGDSRAVGKSEELRLDDVYVKNIASGASAPLIESLRTTEHPAAWSHDEQTLLVFSDDEKGTYLSLWSFAKRALTRLTGPA